VKGRDQGLDRAINILKSHARPILVGDRLRSLRFDLDLDYVLETKLAMTWVMSQEFQGL